MEVLENEQCLEGDTPRMSRATRGRIRKYGAALEPPRDDAIHYPNDDKHAFFAWGRDCQSVYTNHKYTEKERMTLASYESLDILPSHSDVYKHWLKRQPKRLDWDRWLVMGFIGFTVGLIGFLLHQIVDLLSEFKWERPREYLQHDNFLMAWLYVMGFSLLFVLGSSSLVVFLRPSAGGSGLPEVIGFLNGTVVRHIFNVKTLVVKFLSCVLSVAGGLPVGPEGPMIHMGSSVGAGISQFKSDTLRFKLPIFARFRNSEDRRNFISAGAAAGVASAFGAPVGGLLFSMEEVSSFWNMKLSWQIFFCCMISTVTTDLFNSAFSKFQYQGDFGLFKTEKYIIFQVKNGIDVNLLAFVPAALLGVVGGLLGSLFTFMNLKMARARRRLLARLQLPWRQNIVKLAEPLVVIILMCSMTVFVPALFQCKPFTCLTGLNNTITENCLSSSTNPVLVEKEVMAYTCPAGVQIEENDHIYTNASYNEVASLLFGTGGAAIKRLFSRNTHLQFDYLPLVCVLGIYFIMACWASGTSVACGLVVPMLFIGGLYGRIMGKALVDIVGVRLASTNAYWAWVDPGAISLVGAASFFGGVSRLTMSLTVIMMEITNDIQFLLLIMVAIMVAKWVGDYFTHPLYHALLELKCLPFLDAEPVIMHVNKDVVNLELFRARDVMSSPALSLRLRESVSHLAGLLLETGHGGFPVTTRVGATNDEVFFGFITRLEIAVLLKHDENFIAMTNDEEADDMDMAGRVEYEELTIDKLENPAALEDLFQTYIENPLYEKLCVNLRPYVNQSALCIPDKFSLHRTYIIFRTLGLRHLTVVDAHNHILGVITRKDLMGFNMEEKLNLILHDCDFAGNLTLQMSSFRT